MKEFNANDAETDKSNPYHGVLTLPLQCNNATAPSRGPGRPSLADISIEDSVEVDDPVR